MIFVSTGKWDRIIHMELNVFETLYIVIGMIVSLITAGECVYNGYEEGELLIWGVYVLGLVAIGLVH